jgi:hypothetical protein
MEISCSRCGKPFIRRVRPFGVLDHLLSFLYAYPWRCQICRHRFRILQWGVRPDPASVDRRQYLRRPVRLPVRLTKETGELIGTGTTIDLSAAGCSIESDASLHGHDIVRLELEIVAEKPPIVIDAAIVRRLEKPGIALDFLRVSLADETRLNHFVLDLWITGTEEARRGTWLPV